MLHTASLLGLRVFLCLVDNWLYPNGVDQVSDTGITIPTGNCSQSLDGSRILGGGRFSSGLSSLYVMPLPTLLLCAPGSTSIGAAWCPAVWFRYGPWAAAPTTTLLKKRPGTRSSGRTLAARPCTGHMLRRSRIAAMYSAGKTEACL